MSSPGSCWGQVRGMAPMPFPPKSANGLWCVQKANDYQPYPMDQVRHISYQLCKAVSCELSSRSRQLTN